VLQEQLTQHDLLKRQREDLAQAKNLSRGGSAAQKLEKSLFSFQLSWEEDISSVNITVSLNTKKGARGIRQDSESF